MLLDVKNLCFSYYKKPLCLRDVSFCLKKGEKAIVFGAEESGKTTLLKNLSGFDSSYFGSIKLDEKQLKSIPDSEKNVSLLLSEPVFFLNKTIKENIEFMCNSESIKIPSDDELLLLLQKFGIRANLQAKIKKLTLFEKRALAIVRSLIKNPKIIFLDDQIKGLVEDETKKMLENYKMLLKEKNLTIFFACGSESFCECRDFFETQTFDKVFWLSTASVFEYGSAQKMLQEMATLDILAFCKESKTYDGYIGIKDGEYYFVFGDEKFFKLDKKYSKKLDKLNIKSNGDEDARLAVFDSANLKQISDNEFNKNLESNSYVIFSLLDGKRLI